MQELDSLVERVVPLLHRMLRRLGIIARWDREDLIQACFLAWVEKREQVQNPAAWIVSVSKRLAISRIRRRSRRESLRCEALCDAGWVEPSAVPDPEQVFLERERARSAFARLNERERTLVIADHIAPSRHETSAVLPRASSSAARRAARARIRAKLREN